MRASRIPGLPLILTLTLSIPGWSREARADDLGTAEALFEEGVRLYDLRDYVGSCAKLEASQKLVSASGTALNLGRCHEAQGHLFQAWSAFEDASFLARRDGDAKRAAFAHQNAERLKPLLPRLRLVVDEPMAGLEVRLDGSVIDAAAMNVPIPVDPGHHRVQASAPAHVPAVLEVDTTTGNEARLRIPKLAPTTSSGLRPGPAPAPSPSPTTTTWRTVALVTAAAGVAVTGVGTAFGIRAWGLNDSDARCPARCDVRGAELRRDAGAAADVSTVLFSAGLALLVTGAVLWFTHPTPPTMTASAPRTAFAPRTATAR